MASRPPHLPPRALRPLAHLIGRFVLDPDLSVGQQRRRLARVGALERLPEGVTSAAVTVGGVETLRVDAPGGQDSPVLLYLHGGGYCLGSASGSRAFAGQLAAATDATVVVADYRLAPEHPFPAALDDAAAVWKELATEVGAERVAVAGDSAGAGLAVALATTLRDVSEPLPSALGLISPWLDLAADRTTDPGLVRRDPMLRPAWLAACARDYAGGRPLTDPRLSPLHGTTAGLPPTYVVAGADDVLVPDADRFVVAARDAGVDVEYTRVPGLWHDFVLHAGMLAAADHAVAHLARFLDQRWAR